jgi:hypothetical protein
MKLGNKDITQVWTNRKGVKTEVQEIWTKRDGKTLLLWSTCKHTWEYWGQGQHKCRDCNTIEYCTIICGGTCKCGKEYPHSNVKYSGEHSFAGYHYTVCSNCGSMKEACVPSGVYQMYNEDNHGQLCELCGNIMNPENHEFPSSYNTDGKCTKCGFKCPHPADKVGYHHTEYYDDYSVDYDVCGQCYEMFESGRYSHNYRYSYNGDNGSGYGAGATHTVTCSCGCGYSVNESCDTAGGASSLDDGTHLYHCSLCGGTSGRGYCSYEAIAGDDSGIASGYVRCTVCGHTKRGY